MSAGLLCEIDIWHYDLYIYAGSVICDRTPPPIGHVYVFVLKTHRKNLFFLSGMRTRARLSCSVGKSIHCRGLSPRSTKHQSG